MVVKLDFRTDFTRFLTSDKIYHTVKVVTANEVIECSGALLSQHSTTLQELVARDNELFLDNYTHVQDCLLVLHGGEVALNIDNLLDIMKFSVQFGINEMYLQCLHWIERNITKDNILEMFKICCSVSKLAKLCGSTLPEDVFAHCSTYMKMVGPNNFEELYNNQDSATQVDLLQFLAGPRGLLPSFLPLIIDLISPESLNVIIPLLSSNIEELRHTSELHFRNLVNKIDGAVTEHHNYIAYVTEFKCKLLSKSQSDSSWGPYITPNFIPELANIIIIDKLWKNMNSNQLIQAQKIFDSASKHFLYSEIMIAWVAEKKPPQETVKELTQAIIPYKLDADYIEMLNDKYKALGYDEVVSPALLESWEHPSHYFTKTRYHSTTDKGFYVRSQVSCRNGCNLPAVNYLVAFNCPQPGVKSQSFNWSWHGNVCPPANFLTCPNNPNPTENVGSKENLYFYGVTKNDVHLQFHTDCQDALAKWRKGNNVVKIGCVGYDEINNQELA